MKQKSYPPHVLKYKHFYFSFLLFIVFGCKKNFEPVKFFDTAKSVLNNRVTARPNILFIVGDDMGYEVPTCNGGQSYSTPNLDKLALNGLRFTQCHSSPLCAPSRVSLLTGKQNFRNYEKWGYLRTDQKTIANMLSDAGYATCYAGKWQLDGGNNSILKFGWQKYSVWLPFLLEEESMEGSRYKSAKIYQNGGYLPDSATRNKYSDNIFTSYLLNFIDSVHSLNKPFFAYYSMILCHAPHSPTPDDSEYHTWNFTDQKGNPRFFSSEVKFMDKKIGAIINHLRKNNLLANTVIIFIGDNGSPKDVTSLYNNFLVNGGKSQTNEPGTNVPMLIQWDKAIAPNRVSNALISFTDFLPTLADIAGIPKPNNYGILDGISFYPLLSAGDTSSLRTEIFTSYCINPSVNPWRRWVQNDSYKLYDTNVYKRSYTFVKISKCRPDSLLVNLTTQEKTIRENFKAVLRSYDTN